MHVYIQKNGLVVFEIYLKKTKKIRASLKSLHWRFKELKWALSLTIEKEN